MPETSNSVNAAANATVKEDPAITNNVTNIINCRGKNKSRIASNAQKVENDLKRLKSIKDVIENIPDEDLRIIFSDKAALAKDFSEEIQNQIVDSEGSSETSNLKSLAKTLKNAAMRFERDTINISLVGKTGSGKSTFIKSATGLTDDYIPALKGPSCTGTTCIVENDTSIKETTAYFTFKTRSEVLDDAINAANELAERAKEGYSNDPNFKKKVNSIEELKGTFDEDKLKNTIGSKDTIGSIYEKLNKQHKGSQVTSFSTDLNDFKAAYGDNCSDWSVYFDKAGNATNVYDKKGTKLSQCSGGNNGNCTYVTTDAEIIKSFVAKHDGTKGGKTINPRYTYCAVKSALIKANFGGITSKIRLIDTVGIGDNSSDTMQRVDDAINQESDGVLFLFPQPASRTDSSCMGILDSMNTIYRKQNEAQAWMAFAINNQNGDVDICEDQLGFMRDNQEKGQILSLDGGLELFKPALNAGNPDEVKAFLVEFLEHISSNIGTIDKAKVTEADNAYRKAADIKAKITKGTELLLQSLKGDENKSLLDSTLSDRMDDLRKKLIKLCNDIAPAETDEDVHDPHQGLAPGVEMVEEEDDTDSYYTADGVVIEEEDDDVSGQFSPDAEFTPTKAADGFLQKHIDLVQELLDKKEVTLNGFSMSIGESTYNALRAYDKIRASERICDIIRAIGAQPVDSDVEAEKKFRRDVAKCIVDTLGIDLSRLGVDTEPEKLDGQFFTELADKMFSRLNDMKAGRIKNAFYGLDTSKLEGTGTVIKSLFDYYASVYFNPYRNKKQWKKAWEDSNAPLADLIDEHLKAFINKMKSIQEKARTQSLIIENYRQRRIELEHLLMMLDPLLFGNKWVSAFENLYDNDAVLQNEKAKLVRLSKRKDSLKKAFESFLSDAAATDGAAADGAEQPEAAADGAEQPEAAADGAEQPEAASDTDDDKSAAEVDDTKAR